jgi:hypothetical protein
LQQPKSQQELPQQDSKLPAFNIAPAAKKDKTRARTKKALFMAFSFNNELI